MTDILKPIAANDSEPVAATPMGRLADKLAAVLAVIASALGIIGSVIFFAGFAANDSHIAALTSAFAFTALLSAFAVVPPLLTARIAWRAYKHGGTRKGAAFALLLCGPWLVLSSLLIAYTPLPIWVSGLAFVFAALLSIWAVAGLFLER